MSDPMMEIRASFFVECEELLESLFDALQELSEGASDAENINVAFRAVHSIKGGAGAFSLDDLVEFAHHFETAMDEVRSGRLETDEDLIALFFRCGDILSDLVHASRDEVDIDRGGIDPVVSELKAAVGENGGEGGDKKGRDETPDFVPMTIDISDLSGVDEPDVDFDFGSPPDLEVQVPDAPEAAAPGLRVRFKPEPELYESGNEPRSLIRSLADFGPCKTEIEFDPPSSLLPLDPPQTRLGWTIEIETKADPSAVEEVFEFADGLCELSVERIGPAPEETETLPEPSAAEEETAHAPPRTSEPREQSDVQSSPPGPKPSPRQRAAKKAPAAPSATVRVDLDRIDRLVNLVGELVINQAMLSQSVVEADLPSNSPIGSGLDEFLQLTRDIQESVMMIRAQPVKSLFQRMSRIVRESSSALGKRVRLVTEGETTEIDKTVIERLADPLTHMIRNAVDHGLESSEERLSVGKPEEGEVRLTALHRSGRVVIEITDDGGGIDRARVRRIAEEKGLISADANLTDSEIDQLLFMPGFSTAAEVSNLSGRGVGMDVVKNAITSLGGRISIHSAAGKGTTFSISLPLTLAVLDGMVVSVENETLVVPLSAIAETLTLRAEDNRRLGPRTSVVLVRESFVPLLDLGVELGYRDPKSSYGGSIALLIGQEDGSKAALVVDTIEDQRQVVIKGLQDSYGHVPGVAAATILGDGQIALILDPTDLVQSATGHSRAAILQEAG